MPKTNNQIPITNNQPPTTNNQTPATALLISNIFRQLSQPSRIEILLAIGEGEACVCHLEAKLGMRQAYISQHLMALRDARDPLRPQGRALHILPVERPRADPVDSAGRSPGRAP